MDAHDPWHTVVGVVGEVHHSGARSGDVPMWYRPAYQRCSSSMSLAVRTAADPALATRLVKDAIGRIDPYQPIYGTSVMTQLMSDSLRQDRFNTQLLMAFAGLALALAVIGTYGVISYSVSQRKREIGIRMALGAQTEQILGRVVGEGLKLVMIGLGIGVAAALALTQLLKWLLFGIEAYDPPTFIAIAAMLMTAGVLACLVPALRAARVDPMVTLRNP
jgi:putative ABC transport system permease protein